MKKLATLALFSLTCSFAMAQTTIPATQIEAAKPVTTTAPVVQVSNSALLVNDSTKYCLYDGKQYTRGARIKGVQGDLLKCAPSDLYSNQPSELEWTPLI